MVVDDHPVVREGLVTVLGDEPDVDVVGSAGSAEEAIRLAGRERPDVILLDLELASPSARSGQAASTSSEQVLDGVEAIPRLVAVSPETRVIVFTAYDIDERVFGAIRAGARGYLLKGASVNEIAQAIRVVQAGGSALEPRVAAKLMAEVRTPHPATLLTGREQEVLRLVAQGLPNKQIARHLSISERTVKFHLTSVMRKLEADNRAQAVAQAAQRGLL